MTDLPHLKSVRAGHKGVLTRKLNELDDALAASPINSDTLEQLKVVFEEKFDKLRKTNDEIVALLNDETEIVTEIEAGDLLSDSIRAALFKLNRALRTVPTSTSATPSIRGDSSHKKIRLPELTLNPFDGSYTKWPTFWDTYESAIHINSDLTEIDKFTYLRSLLQGSAKEAIAGLSLTAANYIEAVDILKKRFGDKSIITAKHMDALMSLEAVGNSVTALRHFYDSVDTHEKVTTGA